MYKILGALFLIVSVGKALSANLPIPDFSFNSIDGGIIHLNDYHGKTVLISNTASKCGFTGQYEGLQKLYDKYSSEGLVVLGIPSANFHQEYKDNDRVKDFCTVNFGINFPMTEITDVIGLHAHPFYRWLLSEYNYRPRWNFSKILIGPDGRVLDTFGTTVRPGSTKIEKAILRSIKK